MHFGSLVTALASYLQARSHDGQWLLRIEDIDPPREVAGAAESIIESLARHGLHPDADIEWQSANRARHEALLERLIASGQAYACRCSREAVRSLAQIGPAGPVYPGTCRTAHHPTRDGLAAIRLLAQPGSVRYLDTVHGEFSCDVEHAIGDVVIRRKDGLIAYALAVVADDAAAGINEVVRGSDLLPVTPAHVQLQLALSLPTPAYLHIPTAIDTQGQKLAKQTGAAALEPDRAAANLYESLQFLDQEPPRRLRDASVAETLAWAIAHWRPAAIPRELNKTAPQRYANQP